MRRLNLHKPRTAGLLALALGAVAILALSGVAVAKDHHGDDHGHGHGHGRHHHHHHQFPLQEAGTISSFDATTGKLTIALLDGESVTGMVTEDTRLRCEGNDDRRSRRDQGSDDNGGRDNEPGDDNGGRGNEPGDDNGGQNEPGDDHGGDSSGPGPSGEGAPAQGEASCTVASLVPGAVVGAAELRLENGVATFTEVELGFHS
jgi:hypothetical protein